MRKNVRRKVERDRGVERGGAVGRGGGTERKTNRKKEKGGRGGEEEEREKPMRWNIRGNGQKEGSKRSKTR